MKETLWLRLARGVSRLRQRSDWGHFVDADWPERIMSLRVTDRFHTKQGRSTGRWILHRANEQLTVYLKRHYRLARWRGFLATLWPDGGWSPALQEWRHLHWARMQGMPVPAAVAAGEYIGPWGRLQSFLAVEELADMLPLHEAVPAAASRLDAATFRVWKRSLAAEMARLVRALHTGRHFHKDLYLCHFYIPRCWTEAVPLWQGIVHVIDLHRLGHHRLSWRYWQIKDLAQLLYSSEIAGIEDADRLRFWRHYLGSGWRRWSTRLLRYAIVRQGRRYRLHNLKRHANGIP